MIMIQKITSRPRWTDVVLTKIFNASRQKLFNAWTDEKEVARWWGPHGFTNPVCHWNALPAGKIYVELTARDGLVFPMTGVFHAISPPERVEFITWAFETESGEPQLELRNTAIFTEVNGRTKLTFEATVMKGSAEVITSMEGIREGWIQSLEKLEKHIQTRTTFSK